MTLQVDVLWDALREQCCVTRPFEKASRIVMVSQDDIAKALKIIEEKCENIND